MWPTGDAHYEKGFIWVVACPQPSNPGFAGTAEMFSGLCQLQSDVFFSIGHGLPAVAFVVSGPRKLD